MVWGPFGISLQKENPTVQSRTTTTTTTTTTPTTTTTTTTNNNNNNNDNNNNETFIKRFSQGSVGQRVNPPFLGGILQTYPV